jgi:phage terminase large subunit-like protein
MAGKKKKGLLHPTTQYALDVAEGRIVAGAWTIAACRRHLADLESSKDPRYPWRFDESLADRIILFSASLPNVKGASRNLALLPWQQFLLGSLFGWVSKSDNNRRYRTAYVQVSRKNGKSTLAAAIALYCLAADRENGAEVYTAATTRDQARIVFDAALAMIRRSPQMAKALKLEAQRHRIIHHPSLSRMMPLSADSRTLEGLDIHCAIIDELHVHRTREVWDVLMSATGARRQPLIFAITTAGASPEGIGYEVYQYSLAVLRKHTATPGDKLENDRHFAIVYSIDAEDDWRDEKNWIKANPSLGVTVSPDDLRDKAHRAEATPSARGNFLAKHLNIWQSADSAWIDISDWDACVDKSLTLDSIGNMPVWIGVDLATRVDIASVAILAHDGDRYYLLAQHFAPENTAQKQPHYRQFAAAGTLTLQRGAALDIDLIEKFLLDLAGRLDIRGIACDPYQSAQLSQHLRDRGLDAMEFRQTVQNMSPAMRIMEALIADRRIRIAPDPCLRWMAGNVVCHTDNKDNIYPRRASADRKIDGIVASIMALGIAGTGRRGVGVADTTGLVTPGIIVL